MLPPRLALAAGPTALAFFAGGYFARAQLVALLVAAGALAWLAVAAPGALPRGRTALVAIGALAGLAAWSAISRDWAPVPADSTRDAERLALYAVALAAAAAAWRERAAARALEPLLAAGTLVVTGYGLLGRLLPGIVEQRATASSGGRLEQPLTYWNASGALAALGLVLCARLAGDRTRPLPLRAAAAAGAVPLGAGVYLTFSRGALLALAAEIAVLVVLARDWAQVRAAGIALTGAAAGAAICAASPAVRALEGDQRALQGAIVLAVLLALMVAIAALQAAVARGEPPGPQQLRLPSRAVSLGVAVAAALVLVPLLASGTDPAPNRTFGATNERFTNLGSNRYEYWEAALGTAADHPLRGAGAGGFSSAWLERRTIPESVRDAHSLELEIAAELGLVGLALLAALLLAVGRATARVHASDPALAAGFGAALTTYLVAASIDWHWEMPAVTLVALVLAGAMLSERTPRRPAA
jgi:O-Antigen ligase